MTIGVKSLEHANHTHMKKINNKRATENEESTIAKIGFYFKSFRHNRNEPTYATDENSRKRARAQSDLFDAGCSLAEK